MIGIDLGTTNSAVAIMEGKIPRIIENSEGMSLFPLQPFASLPRSLLNPLTQVPELLLRSLPSPRMASAWLVSPPSDRPSSTRRTLSSPLSG